MSKGQLDLDFTPETIFYDQPQVTVDTTVKIFRTGNRPFRVGRVRYVNPTGVAQSDTNWWVLNLQHGAGPTVAASYSTKTTGGQGTIAANTFVDLVLAADPGMVVPANTDVSVFLDLTGTLTLPPGRFQIEGWWL